MGSSRPASRPSFDAGTGGSTFAVANAVYYSSYSLLVLSASATTITFQFNDGQPAQTHVAASGESVLDVALNNGIQLQHNCGGVCGCSTCHVYINSGGNDLPEISDKEEDFIDRAENPRINSRLACQCVVEADMQLVVTIPPQHFLGH
jgi:2Fe-2S ferredoxin